MTTKTGKAEPLPPGSTIGILGGGQLGRMLALGAARLGLKTHVYSDESESCAFYVATETTRASFRDSARLAQFARRCDAVTFEFENVPDETVRELMQHVRVAPGPEPLRIAQDRFFEKSFLQQQGLLTAPFRNVTSEAEAREAFVGLGGRAVLKTRRLGYDGKGQRIVLDAEKAARAFTELGGVPSIVEGFVEFAFETSVIAARGQDVAAGGLVPPQLRALPASRRAPGRDRSRTLRHSAGLTNKRLTPPGGAASLPNMRLTAGGDDRIQRLQEQIDGLLERSWKGKDAEDLARQLRRLRLQIAVETAGYQARMRELQRERAKGAS